MRGIRQCLAVSVVSTALVFGQVARAMQILQFDKMDYRDQSGFVTQLEDGAWKDLMARGEEAQAKRLDIFFKDRSEKGGWKQFDKNLDLLRAANKTNANDPNFKDPPFEVEDAMELTLDDAKIPVTIDTLMAIGKNFKPKYPTQKSGGVQKH